VKKGATQHIWKVVATLCLFGIGFGWPLGGPSVAQGPPKRRARDAHGWIGAIALFATRAKKWRWGLEEIAEIAKNRVIAEIENRKPYH
jgi:hypothetical protein